MSYKSCSSFPGAWPQALAGCAQDTGMAMMMVASATVVNMLYDFVVPALPFGCLKHSGFGRFGGVEGLRVCCFVKAVLEDQWWPFVKTKIPMPAYSENGFEIQESLVEAHYGSSSSSKRRN